VSDRETFLRGVVRNGVVVPTDSEPLPEGADVEIKMLPMAFSPEEAAEFAGWEKIGDEAWAMIDWGEGEIARDSG
jgi:hypothetical protein